MSKVLVLKEYISLKVVSAAQIVHDRKAHGELHCDNWISHLTSPGFDFFVG